MSFVSRKLACLLLLTVVAGMARSWTIEDNPRSNDFTCNCDYCDDSKVRGIEDDDPEAEEETTLEKDMYTEDFDGDGDRTICARDRDVEDRSFASVCHMLCHNKCTRYRVMIYKVLKEKKYVLSAFRTDFYKLRDGPC